MSHRQDPPWIGTFDRTGTVLRTRRVGHLAIEPHLAYFDGGDPARGRYLVFDRWAQQLWITVLSFAVLGQVDLDTLGVGYAGDLTAIRSGPHAGALAFLSRSADFRFPEGETGAEAQRRIVEFLEEKRRQHAGENIILVSHEGLIRLLMCTILDLPVYKRWNFHYDFCGIMEIAYQPEYAIWKLRRFNQVCM